MGILGWRVGSILPTTAPSILFPAGHLAPRQENMGPATPWALASTETRQGADPGLTWPHASGGQMEFEARSWVCPPRSRYCGQELASVNGAQKPLGICRS